MTVAPCKHLTASRRLWVEGGKPRHDRFCIDCGLNVERDAPLVFWVDVGGPPPLGPDQAEAMLLDERRP